MQRRELPRQLLAQRQGRRQWQRQGDFRQQRRRRAGGRVFPQGGSSCHGRFFEWRAL
jgi:hypothetical protein